MRKIGVGIVAVICICIVCFALVACDKSESVKPETDLTIDTSSPIGLYFYASDGTYKRYSENIGKEYFDAQKPTVAFFHGWLPEASGFQEGEICHNADSFVLDSWECVRSYI